MDVFPGVASMTMQQYNRFFQDEAASMSHLMGPAYPAYPSYSTVPDMAMSDGPVYGPSVTVTHPQFVNINDKPTEDLVPKEYYGSRPPRPPQDAVPQSFLRGSNPPRGSTTVQSKVSNKFPQTAPTDPILEMELQHQRLEEYAALQQQMMMQPPMPMDPLHAYAAQMQFMQMMQYSAGFGGMGTMAGMLGMDPAMMGGAEIDMLMGETGDGTALPGMVVPPALHEKGHEACPCIHCAAANQLLMTPARSTNEGHGYSPEQFTPHSIRSSDTPQRPRDWSQCIREKKGDSFDRTPSERRQPMPKTPSTVDRDQAKRNPATAEVSGATEQSTPSRGEGAEARRGGAVWNVEVAGHFGRKFLLRCHHTLSLGDHVIFEGDRGNDLGVVRSAERASAEKEKDSSKERKERPWVLRAASADEVERWSTTQREEAAEAATIAAAGAKREGLPFTICCAAYQFDHKKLTFFYESDSRVDFRRFLPELYTKFRCRIWFERVDDLEL